ncbi:hypothetical protein GDO81_026775 [Engystomops pustulosus]|uniref:Sushi domain-containing protein n=1 Tax=Engystomops pustulosus TaxID=76066 RepID=A0AAV6ZFP0_ENGPU|nr:hypothetical protein GDO81_026775 [Engystomops pustulosus]
MTPGQWSAIPPKCEAIQCERPEQPENGTMKCFSDEKMLPFNSTCQFTCDEGFTIVGSYSTQCLTTGQWIESPPKCKATLCRRPEIPLNGAVSCTHSGETLPEKSTCNFMCAEGYKLIGPSSVACAGADQWTGGIPICEYMQCDSLTAPVNGLIRCKNGFSYNSTCEFSCVEGYEMIGSSELQCLSSRQWTSSVPFCKAIQCPYMPSLKNGRMVCQDGTKYESQCSFSCLKGFRLNGSPVLTCQSSGAWTSSVPTCEALQCPSLTAPEDGYMVCQNATKYKSQCSFTCLKGFKLIGSPTLSCQSSGEWTSSVPTCEAVQCNVIVAPSMGKMNCSRLDFGYGTVCKFTCEYDLSLNGTDTLECYSDGSWNTETPTCDTMKTPYDAATYLTVGITSGASVLSTASLILWLIKRMRKTAKKFTPTNSYQDLEAPGIYQNTENVDDV